MGTRSNYETLARVLMAFRDFRTWRQADLARRVGIGSRALSRALHEMQRAGFQVTREVHTPDVFWRCQNEWWIPDCPLQNEPEPNKL